MNMLLEQDLDIKLLKEKQPHHGDSEDKVCPLHNHI